MDSGFLPLHELSMEKCSDFDEESFEFDESIDFYSESRRRRYYLICITIFVLITIWGVIFSAIALLQNRQSIGRPRGNNYNSPSNTKVIDESISKNARMAVKKTENQNVIVEKNIKEKLIPYGDAEDAGQPIFSEDKFRSPYWSEMVHGARSFKLSREVESENVNQSLLGQYFARVNKFRNACRTANGNLSRVNNIFHLLAFTIEEVGVCDREVVHVLIIVQSSPDNFHNRQLIRQSYGSMNFILEKNVRLIFVLGRSLNGDTNEFVKNESLIYRDIIQGNFIDHRRNRTLNLNLALWWIGYHCPQVGFIVKVSDDSFVDTGHLLMLLPHLPSRNLLYCKSIVKQLPMRDAKDTKRYLSFSEFPDKILPDYCQSFALLFSNDVASQLLGCSLETTHVLLSIDEIFFTGVVREKLSLNIEDAWPGHQIEFLMPNMVDPIVMSDYMVLGSTTPTIQEELWYKLWKNTLLVISSRL